MLPSSLLQSGSLCLNLRRRFDLGRAHTQLEHSTQFYNFLVRQVYNEKYRKESQAHYDAYEKALQNATSQQIYEENVLRRKYKLPLLKDPRAPKRPYMNGFMYYLQELRQVDTRFSSLSPQEQAKEGARMYKELSDAEKKVGSESVCDMLVS